MTSGFKGLPFLGSAIVPRLWRRFGLRARLDLSLRLCLQHEFQTTCACVPAFAVIPCWSGGTSSSRLLAMICASRSSVCSMCKGQARNELPHSSAWAPTFHRNDPLELNCALAWPRSSSFAEPLHGLGVVLWGAFTIVISHSEFEFFVSTAQLYLLTNLIQTSVALGISTPQYRLCPALLPCPQRSRSLAPRSLPLIRMKYNNPLTSTRCHVKRPISRPGSIQARIQYGLIGSIPKRRPY